MEREKRRGPENVRRRREASEVGRGDICIFRDEGLLAKKDIN